jgi:hypothetical protein
MLNVGLGCNDAAAVIDFLSPASESVFHFVVIKSEKKRARILLNFHFGVIFFF